MFDEDEYIHEYIFSGSLPENASTYVKREADDELYQALQDGKFCYVLNSRQSGKSSLRVRTMSRLTNAGVECASIDLSSVSIQSATQETWYADLIVKLIDSFVLDLDFKDWWEKNQINSPLMRFSNFLEKHLLVEIEENIVIFIDEIDSVLSLKFPTDDFFAFIRACYNQRVDNPAYKRLTFCLLGVASPGNLIQDKSRTPFNIGKAISLKGFQLHETEPLIKGLQGKFSEPQAVMEEILDWTGGQPFLTQKLCQFMLEESEQENWRTVEEVVKSRIIENWESQDEPEHLRTIRSRIFRNEERTGYLLDLYQKIRSSEEQSDILDPPNPPYEGGLESSSLSISITADNTIEQSELLLSGLVARREGKLRVYNRIYQEVFNQNWVENELKNLRPYSESFKFWVASGGKDESRLLRGKALAGAEKWAKDKNLSYQDKQFLAASQTKEKEEEITAKEKQAELERERKDKEAAELRNLVLSEANTKAKQLIRNGTVVLAVTLLSALSAVTLAWNQVNKANVKHQKIKAEVETVQKLSKLAGELRNENFITESDQALRQAGLSFRVDDHHLKQAMLLASMVQGYQRLKQPNEAQTKIEESLKYLNKKENNISSVQGLQIKAIVKETQGNLLKEKNKSKAIKAYQESYNILKKHRTETNPFTENQIITAENIRVVHLRLLNLLENKAQENLRKEVGVSLKKYFFTELEYFLKKQNWQKADTVTGEIILLITSEFYPGNLQVENFPCPFLKKINNYWLQYSEGNFGFSVQKKIWVDTGNRLQIKDWNNKDRENFTRFINTVGWSEHLDNYMERVKKDPKNSSIMGGLPSLTRPGVRSSSGSRYWIFPDKWFEPGMLFTTVFSRTASCGI